MCFRGLSCHDFVVTSVAVSLLLSLSTTPILVKILNARERTLGDYWPIWVGISRGQFSSPGLTSTPTLIRLVRSIPYRSGSGWLFCPGILWKPMVTTSHATRRGTLVRSRVSSLSHCGLIWPRRWNCRARPDLHKNTKLSQEMHVEKATTKLNLLCLWYNHTSCCVRVHACVCVYVHVCVVFLLLLSFLSLVLYCFVCICISVGVACKVCVCSFLCKSWCEYLRGATVINFIAHSILLAHMD